MAVLSADGVLCNFTAADFAALWGSTPVNTPPPTITNLNPAAVVHGAAQFVLTVNGTNFVNPATVIFDGAPLATTIVSPTQVTATVPAARVTAAKTVAVRVDALGGSSANSTFTIT